MKEKNEDGLKNWFQALPEVPVSSDFRAQLLARLSAEAMRQQRRADRRCLWAIIATSCCMMASLVVFFWYIGWPKMALSTIDWGLCLFYFQIGAIALILLGLDHLLRQKIQKKRNTAENREKEQYL